MASRLLGWCARSELVTSVWHHLGAAGSLQWRLLWLSHPTFLVGVAGVVLNDAGEVLLLRHRYWPRGSWGLPAGCCERGETVEMALAREVREETGYHAERVEVLRVVSGHRLRIEVVLRARLAGGSRRLCPAEVLEARFFAPSSLPAGLLVEHRRFIELAGATAGPGS